MNKSAILKKYKQIGKDLEGQRSNLKQAVGELASKNVEETKSDDESFYSNKQKSLDNIDRIKSALTEKKRLLEESNINKDDVFLFSNAPQKETYNLQLQILRSVSSGLKTVQAVKERAAGEETFAQNRRKKIDEFNVFVKIKDVKKIKDKSKILEDIFIAEKDYYYDILDLSSASIGGKDEKDTTKLIEKIKSKTMPLYKNAFKNVEEWHDDWTGDNGFATFIVGVTYHRCKKLSEVFNVYGIENFIVSGKVKGVVDDNEIIDTDKYLKTRGICNDTKKSIEKEYGIKKFFRNLLLFLATLLITSSVIKSLATSGHLFNKRQSELFIKYESVKQAINQSINQSINQ